MPKLIHFDPNFENIEEKLVRKNLIKKKSNKSGNSKKNPLIEDKNQCFEKIVNLLKPDPIPNVKLYPFPFNIPFS